MRDPSFTIGVEEEYLLVDPATRDLATDPPAVLMSEAEALEGQVGPEFLRSQLEIGTKVCSSIAELRSDLGRLRRQVSDVVEGHGLKLMAASTHPFAEASAQLPTPKDRYLQLEQDLQGVVRRLMICGMHVHVGVEDEDLRIDLMGQISYFLPHLLALSTSSPFWHGQDSGLKSYRTSVFRSMPRTGLPADFSSWAEYQRHVDALVAAGVIEDASKLWWDVRPSCRYPTLEMRISDICTNVDDTITIAALYVCLLSMLYRRRQENQRWRSYLPMLVNENVWRAERYGISESLIDFGKGVLVEYVDLVDELIELVREDAEAFDCVAEVEHAREIVRRGTSADSQLGTYRKALARGATHDEALQAVVDWLVEETATGI
ncbi:MAG: carboxylate-amine ligase [Acidimicrobiia bacterium]|nr:carboxylate-amine ligase [Acidimicrobiia bacterium]